MVVIVDPHLKRTSNYPVYNEASEHGLLVKPKSGEGEYEGWCWSGSSSWIDFFNPASWGWWTSLFKTQQLDGGWSWMQSTEDVHIWNDMNEVTSSLLVTICVAYLDHSHPYSMALKLRCRKTTSITVAGNIATFIISTECYTYDVHYRPLHATDFKPLTSLTLLHKPYACALTLQYVRLFSLVLSSLARSALVLCGLVTTLVHGNIWLLGSK